MVQKRYDQNNLISTEFKRRNTRPLPPRSDTDNLTSNIPHLISFEILAESTPARLFAYTNSEIIIGRRARPQDPRVHIDLTQYHAQAYGVSRIHAMVAVVKGFLTLQDLNSVNGTLINDRQALPLERYVLKNDDEIMVGNLKMRLHFVKS